MTRRRKCPRWADIIAGKVLHSRECFSKAAAKALAAGVLNAPTEESWVPVRVR